MAPPPRRSPSDAGLAALLSAIRATPQVAWSRPVFAPMEAWHRRRRPMTATEWHEPKFCDETGDDDEGGRDYGDDGVDAGDGHGGDTKYGHDNGGAKDVDMYVRS